ncbi:uncharacterized protein [Elaeis guineensis]|uniref:Uncharacterized protein LOC105055429 n=2 Tax=Elaeis guineensis var. tenera TaxID=51953 RepID=A0A6I9S0G9_ELAGV|nr:uncharacterized protein LOC105055429 [Elaeis guineensis]XP_010935538.1 uncharacterized protein LOC105055429 [Elaeis guineensis]
MPCGHSRTNSNVEKVAERRSRTLFKRSLDHSKYKFCSKECEAPGHASRNCEQRGIIFTLVALELDAYWKLAPLLPSLQGVDVRNHLRSGAPSDMDGLGSSSPPQAIIFHLDLPKEQKINLLECTDSTNPLLVCNSSRGVVLGESNNRKSKPFSNSSGTRTGCLVSDHFSGSVCDSLNAVDSDFLVSEIPKGDKSVKRNSRKKGKKKGKQYKRATRKQVTSGLEIQNEQSVCSPVSDTTTNSDLVCLGERTSEHSESEKATFPSLSIEDTTAEKDDSENNNIYTDCPTTLMSSTSYSDEIDESDQIASLSQESAGKESSYDSATSVNNASNTAQTPEIVLTIFDENNKNVNLKQNSNFSDNSPSISSDSYSTPMLDSYLNDWNSNISENSIDDVETLLSVKDANGLSSSGGGMTSDSRNSDTSCHTAINLCDMNTEMLSDGCIGNSCWSNDVVNICNGTERAQCSSEACSSNDFLPVSGKRGRRARKMTGVSQNGPNRFHGPTGKENNHSVWQKVQKIDTEAPIHETEAIKAVAPQDNTSSKGSNARIRSGTSVGLKQNQSGKPRRNSSSDEVVKADLCKVASDTVNTSEVASKLIDGNSVHHGRKKASSAFKQAYQYSRKASYAAKVSMNRASKNHVPPNEGMPILPQVNHGKHISTGLRSPCSADYQQLLAAPADKIDHFHPEPQQKAQNYIEEVASSGNSDDTVCGMSSSTAYDDIGASPSDSSDQVYVEVTSDSSSTKYSREEPCLTDSEGNQCLKLETESSHMEWNKPDGGTGSVLQKWVPVGRKESTVCNMSHLKNIKVSVVEDLVPDKSDSWNVKTEVSTSNTRHFTPLTGGGFPCSSPRAEDKVFSSVEADQANSILRNHSHVAEESGGALAVSNCQSHEVKTQCFSRSETDLDKIIEAVHDAHKLHIVADIAHLASGSPLADFEGFLYSASPVIGQTHSIRSCRTCFKEQLIGDSLCSHQIPSISLKSLWQWYEEPGCFGLEVKAQDYHKSKRLHNGYSEFSAYFVPYLSAVQLFGRSRNTRNDSPDEVAIASEVDKRLKTPSNLCSLPIFSMLLPQPSKVIHTCLSESSSSAKDEFCDRLDRSACKGDVELIFEYFESDQPPWRRPLFEKINELVGGDTLSHCRAFGDPLNLESINLHDLHPASWYSVAWYPIYRIPDCNFHAAFLTYHSLGHFVHRSSSSKASDSLSCIVSPVVGLQTYNDKGECWFKLKDSFSKVIQNEEAQYSNPSEILKERLRTLKQVSNVMARASVFKGNQRSGNRHPDYEFFLSRSQ